MWGNKFGFKFEETKKENIAKQFTKKLIRSDIDRINSSLIDDVNKLIQDKCVYIPNFLCKTTDLSYFDKLKSELKQNDVVNWSKHQKIENPTFSQTFKDIIEKISTHFNMEVVETRLNYYKNGQEWKPFHQDRHAYGNIRENYTVGVSLGDERSLEFKHIKTGNIFSFPQRNGDLFAFDKEVNQMFQHGVPKSFQAKERISIIAWGVKK